TRTHHEDVYCPITVLFSHHRLLTAGECRAGVSASATASRLETSDASCAIDAAATQRSGRRKTTDSACRSNHAFSAPWSPTTVTSDGNDAVLSCAIGTTATSLAPSRRQIA